jgi:hypothetical protein
VGSPGRSRLPSRRLDSPSRCAISLASAMNTNAWNTSLESDDKCDNERIQGAFCYHSYHLVVAKEAKETKRIDQAKKRVPTSTLHNPGWNSEVPLMYTAFTSCPGYVARM